MDDKVMIDAKEANKIGKDLSIIIKAIGKLKTSGYFTTGICFGIIFALIHQTMVSNQKKTLDDDKSTFDGSKYTSSTEVKPNKAENPQTATQKMTEEKEDIRIPLNSPNNNIHDKGCNVEIIITHENIKVSKYIRN